MEACYRGIRKEGRTMSSSIEFKTLWQSKNKKWDIVEMGKIGTDQSLIIVVNNDTSWNDNPIRYNDGRVAYDFPERIPSYIKEKVKRILESKDKTVV